MSTKEANDSKADDKECPTCGRDDFKNRRGMEVHHSMAHDESLTEVTYTCEVCGDENTVPRAWAKKNPTKYCSRECSGRVGRKGEVRDIERECAAPECDVVFSLTGAKPGRKFCSLECVYGNRSRDGPTRITAVCEQCGDEYEARPDREDITRFCSRECSAAWQSENLTGKDAPQWNRVGVACGWCGDEKHVTPHRYNRLENHFCGQGCFEKWMLATPTNEGENSPVWKKRPTVICEHCDEPYQVVPHRADESRFCSPECFRVHQAGENHPCWQGGAPPYGPGWTEELRESVRERQGRRCAGCGTHESELPRKLDVHHIIPARSFDDPTDRNDDLNLVAMCQLCHKRWEGTPLRPQLAD